MTNELSTHRVIYGTEPNFDRTCLLLLNLAPVFLLADICGCVIKEEHDI